MAICVTSGKSLCSSWLVTSSQRLLNRVCMVSLTGHISGTGHFGLWPVRWPVITGYRKPRGSCSNCSLLLEVKEYLFGMANHIGLKILHNNLFIWCWFTFALKLIQKLYISCTKSDNFGSSCLTGQDHGKNFGTGSNFETDWPVRTVTTANPAIKSLRPTERQFWQFERLGLLPYPLSHQTRNLIGWFESAKP